ncbi:hypothetical protein ACIQXQ_20050 [Peribacillus sp. NPDC097198]|uniref:hypothetical protein n=1 Tax=Peribacillus sp. NPDC097198 TaxID=3364397 RepID=UPI00380308CD
MTDEKVKLKLNIQEMKNKHNRFVDYLESKGTLTSSERKVLQNLKSAKMNDYYKMAFSILKGELNKEFDNAQRVNILTEMINHPLFSYIQDYIDHWKFGLYNGALRSQSPLYSDSYFALTISDIAWYLIQEHAKDYGLLSDEAIKRQAFSNRIVGIDESFDEESMEAVRGLEINIDLLEKYVDGSNVINGLSKDKYRELRDKNVLENLDKFDELKEQYNYHLNFGLLYGFSNQLDKDEKKILKSNWIKHFSKDESIYSPQQRYLLLNKMYNQLGTDIVRINDILRKPVMSKKSKQVIVAQYDSNAAESFVLGLINLSDPNHINSLLTVQYDDSIRKYFPLYKLIKEKYSNKPESTFQIVKDELKDAIQHADLSNEDEDIIKLIIGEHEDIDVYGAVGEEGNPYPKIIEFINHKYNENYTVGKLKNVIKNRIAKNIGDTYADMESGLGMKKCTRCREEKFVSKNNFGKDQRNVSDGFKSVCRKCEAKYIKKKRKIS